MRKTTTYLLSLAAILCVAATPAIAGGKGDGGCIITPKAPIYNASTGEKVLGNADVGDSIVGITTRGIMPPEFIFEEENGRVHIAYFLGKDESGQYRTAWMNPADIAKFSYECGCGSSKKAREECTPYSGIFSLVYNTCYKEARDKKRAEILKRGEAVAAPVSESSATTKRAEKALLNEDILSLVKVGLEDKLIIAKIQAAKSTDFDLSTNGLVALKTAKVSNAVIDAMMKRGTKN